MKSPSTQQHISNDNQAVSDNSNQPINSNNHQQITDPQINHSPVNNNQHDQQIVQNGNHNHRPLSLSIANSIINASNHNNNHHDHNNGDDSLNLPNHDDPSKIQNHIPLDPPNIVINSPNSNNNPQHEEINPHNSDINQPMVNPPNIVNELSSNLNSGQPIIVNDPPNAINNPSNVINDQPSNIINDGDLNIIDNNQQHSEDNGVQDHSIDQVNFNNTFYNHYDDYYEQSSLNSFIFTSNYNIQNDSDYVHTPIRLFVQQDPQINQPLRLQHQQNHQIPQNPHQRNYRQQHQYQPPQNQQQLPQNLIQPQPQNIQQPQIITVPPNEEEYPQALRGRRRYTYMPTCTVQALQRIDQEILFGSIARYDNEDQQMQSQHVFYQILNRVLFANIRRKRNKRFLQMVFNDVDQELNNNIRGQNITAQHQIYFDLLQEHGRVMNYVKLQLREAFILALTSTYMREYAFNKPFRTYQVQRQQILYKYLKWIKVELINGFISGNVERDDVERDDVERDDERDEWLQFIGEINN